MYCSQATSSILPSHKTVVDVPKDGLLKSYGVFLQRYDELLGQYLAPDADTCALVRDTIKAAKALQPLQTTTWGTRVRGEIPIILAGVFAFFTVHKSGESFNRLSGQGEQMGQKLLLKPHNIQVRTHEGGANPTR